MRFWLLLLAVASPACAQPFSFGVKGGVPLSDFFDAVNSDNLGYFSSTNRYIVGPTVELRLPFGLGVEFDALYRHLHYSSVFNSEFLTTVSTTSGDWEFPLLAKYRFHAPLIRPYVDGGVAWDTLSGLTQTGSQVLPTGTTTVSNPNPTELQHSTVSGVVLGGGLDIHAIILHISPEIRYTRWISPHFEASPLGTNSLHSVQNQFEFLVGFTF